MRVIAGSAKGRRLVAPAGFETRPLTDRAKEGLFSSLGAAIEGARVLDLYAGSGSLGIEALSRGAAEATFVEASPAALAALRQNLENLGLAAEVVADRVEAYVVRGRSHFDVVFVDPPYSVSLASVEELMVKVADRVAGGGRVVVHRRAGEPAPEPPASLSATGSLRYGDTLLWRFEKEDH